MKASLCNDGITIALKVHVNNLTTLGEKEMEIDFWLVNHAKKTVNQVKIHANFQKLLDLVTAETSDTGMTRTRQNASHLIGVSVAFELNYEKSPLNSLNETFEITC